MKLKQETYDILAFIGRIGLNALATFVLTLGKIWGIPYADKIGATLVALATLICVLLSIESKNYFDEHEIVEKEEY